MFRLKLVATVGGPILRLACQRVDLIRSMTGVTSPILHPRRPFARAAPGVGESMVRASTAGTVLMGRSGGCKRPSRPPVRPNYFLRR
jgi:hypothetical protein